MRYGLSASCILLASAAAQAAQVFPVKAYLRPEEAIVVKFVNEKGEEGKKAVQELGADAARLDWLFGPAAPTDIAGADGRPAFKVMSATGEEVKLNNVKPGADGTVDLSAAAPTLKEGGTYYVFWKDAPPLVIENLHNPGRSDSDLKRAEARMGRPLTADEKADQFPVAAIHLEMAQIAVITTDKGVMKAKFSYESAPYTVDNYIALSRQKFYDGAAFHRIIGDFMLQGGDGFSNVTGKAGTGGPGYEIMHEFSDKKHLRGTLSMARSSPSNGGLNDLTSYGSSYFDTSGSQFFIMIANKPYLDGSYSAFGDVYEGLDVIDALAKTPSEQGSGTVRGPMPKIQSIRILPAAPEIYMPKK
ncbi:MAG TPA: peptidylprolyl isomerase [Phycisphaerae bacterium]|nr:peptidylprolyl isomerase [Phycisphaerae bacterium]